MKPLVVIPARGGSKGVPEKNIKKLGGKPLICYTIEAAREVFDDEVICVSTNDKSIKKTVEQTGLRVPFLRPPELAKDTSGTEGVLLHALEYYRENGYVADTLVLLQPTSPFRTARHIKEATNLYHPNLDRVVSVKETESNPYYVLFEENDDGFLEPAKKGDFTRRQDCPKVWELNGAIYVINVESLTNSTGIDSVKTLKYVMGQESSIDIDSNLDWEMAKILVSKNNEHNLR
jgi:N-acylneuraminate cytidylyltransferase